MRATVNELMDSLGVGYVPGAYETVPWSHTDSEKGVTCSAEVRMGMEGDDVEAEIQMLYDNPPEGKGPMEPICYLKAAPAHEGKWTLTEFRIRNQPYGKDAFGWEDKGCDFFQAVVNEIRAGNMPDIEEILDEAFNKRERFTGTRGGGGGKSPKIKPAALMNIRKGGF